MRIGFHNPWLGNGAPGGGEKYLITMIEALAGAVEAQFVVLSPGRPAAAELASVGVALPAGTSWEQCRWRELPERSRGLDLLVTLATDVPPPHAARRAVAMVQFPFRPRERPWWRARAALATGLGHGPGRVLASYDLLLCNSRFTRTWIERRLGARARVVAPPVDVPADRCAVKDTCVLAVGRFFRGAHEKRHDVLIRAFQRVARDPRAERWELHLVGNADERPQTLRWVEELRQRAAGLPVRLHVNAPRAQLVELGARAALFWHATGFEVNAQRHPERLEHFGIATAEAMAYGAVPLVVPAGGHAEFVSDGETGRHWRTIDELVEATLELIADPISRRRLGAAARERAREFDRANFVAAVRNELLPLLHG